MCDSLRAERNCLPGRRATAPDEARVCQIRAVERLLASRGSPASKRSWVRTSLLLRTVGAAPAGRVLCDGGPSKALVSFRAYACLLMGELASEQRVSVGRPRTPALWESSSRHPRPSARPRARQALARASTRTHKRASPTAPDESDSGRAFSRRAPDRRSVRAQRSASYQMEPVPPHERAWLVLSGWGSARPQDRRRHRGSSAPTAAISPRRSTWPL